MRNANSQEILVRKLRLIRSQLDDCLSALERPGLIKTPRKPARIESPRVLAGDDARKLDFEQPIVAFIRKHVGKMSGPKKFTLLLARLTKGDMKKEISHQVIEAHWNKMTRGSLLDLDFNRFYASQARQKDWVEQKKKGLYSLRPSWREIFGKV